VLHIRASGEYNSALAPVCYISAPAGVLKRIEDIEDLPDEDKNHLFYVIDNLIKAVKLKSIA
tara:strand:+ start:707 stop:892 length:186 start_codon:yes stop_codon:yes gene_type:complete